MIHPGSFADHQPTTFALYAVYSQTRLKIWEWSAEDRGRVVNAMLPFEDAESRACAAVQEALRIANAVAQGDERDRRSCFARLAALYGRNGKHKRKQGPS